MPISQEAQDVIDKILSNCEAARRDIDAQRTTLGTRLNQLESPIPPRALTPAEEAEVTKINTAIDALSESDDELSIVTLEALNDSATVKGMADSIKAVNTGLKTKLEKVQKTAQKLQEIADFIKTLDGIAQNLIKLATLLA